MKSLIAFLVAVLLPLQLSWGVAASYCQHEATVRGFNHFGHHSHVHTEAKAGANTQADPQVNAQADPKFSAAKLMTDMDCGVCHASLLAMLAVWGDLPTKRAGASAPSSCGHPGASALQRTPDRPQWPRLA